MYARKLYSLRFYVCIYAYNSESQDLYLIKQTNEFFEDEPTKGRDSITSKMAQLAENEKGQGKDSFLVESRYLLTANFLPCGGKGTLLRAFKLLHLHESTPYFDNDKEYVKGEVYHGLENQPSPFVLYQQNQKLAFKEKKSLLKKGGICEINFFPSRVDDFKKLYGVQNIVCVRNTASLKHQFLVSAAALYFRSDHANLTGLSCNSLAVLSNFASLQKQQAEKFDQVDDTIEVSTICATENSPLLTAWFTDELFLQLLALGREVAQNEDGKFERVFGKGYQIPFSERSLFYDDHHRKEIYSIPSLPSNETGKSTLHFDKEKYSQYLKSVEEGEGGKRVVAGSSEAPSKSEVRYMKRKLTSIWAERQPAFQTFVQNMSESMCSGILKTYRRSIEDVCKDLKSGYDAFVQRTAIDVKSCTSIEKVSRIGFAVIDQTMAKTFFSKLLNGTAVYRTDTDPILVTNNLSFTYAFGVNACDTHAPALQEFVGQADSAENLGCFEIFVDGVYFYEGVYFSPATVQNKLTGKYIERPLGHLTIAEGLHKKVMSNAGMAWIELATKISDEKVSFDAKLETTLCQIGHVDREEVKTLNIQIRDVERQIDAKRAEIEPEVAELSKTFTELSQIRQSIGAQVDEILRPYRIGTSKKLNKPSEDCDPEEFQTFKAALRKAGEIGKPIKQLQKQISKVQTRIKRLKEPLEEAMKEKRKYVKLIQAEHSNSPPPSGVFDFNVRLQKEALVDFKRKCEEILEGDRNTLNDSVDQDKEFTKKIWSIAWLQISHVSLHFQACDYGRFSEEYYNYCMGQPDVSVQEEEGTGEDLVAGFRAKVDARGTPDDVIYKRSPHLLQTIRRGLSWKKDNAGKKLSAFGLKKFSGVEDNLIDGDKDAELEFDLDGVTRILPTYKANGENGQFGFLTLSDGSVTLYAGSKNLKVYIPWSELGNFRDHLPASQHYSFANEIATHLCNMLLNMESKESLVNFVLATGCTIVFEYESVSHQHIVLLEENRIVLIGLTSPFFTVPISHPILTYLFGRMYGFKTVIQSLEFRKPTDFRQIVREVAQEYQSEGSVPLCFTADGACRQMKLKSAWYIMLRAIREISCRLMVQGTKAPSEINAAVEKRLNSLKHSKDFLPLKDKAIDLWKDSILIPFCHWLCYENRMDVELARNQFPVHYSNFLTQKGKDDTVKDLYSLVDEQLAV
eukprot:g6324.t1